MNRETGLKSNEWLHGFRHSSPYINAHRGRTVVLTMPGDAIEHRNFINIIHDIALLSSLGVRLVAARRSSRGWMMPAWNPPSPAGFGLRPMTICRW